MNKLFIILIVIFTLQGEEILPVAKVIKGKAQVLRTLFHKKATIKKNNIIYSKDTIFSKNSKLYIKLNNNSKIVMLKNSSLKITNFNGIFQSRGSIIYGIKYNKIITPFAKVYAKKSIFKITSTKKQKTIFVKKGKLKIIFFKTMLIKTKNKNKISKTLTLKNKDFIKIVGDIVYKNTPINKIVTALQHKKDTLNIFYKPYKDFYHCKSEFRYFKRAKKIKLKASKKGCFVFAKTNYKKCEIVISKNQKILKKKEGIFALVPYNKDKRAYVQYQCKGIL